MSSDQFDIPDVPDVDQGAGDGGRPRRGLLWFAGGLLVGVAATLLLPPYLGPQLPGFLGGEQVEVEGRVLEKERGEERLLLTLDSSRGAVLATFRERIPELDLLIGQGDMVTLRVREFRPFLERPVLVGVKKGDWAGPGDAADTAAAARPADTGGAEETAPGDAGDPADTSGAQADTGTAPADTGAAPETGG